MTTAAIAVIIRREKDLVAHFGQMRATSAETAQSIEALHVERNHFFHRLEQRAVIRQSSTGLYYLDRPSWNAMNAMRRRIVFLVIGIAIAVGVIVVYTAQTRVVTSSAPASNVP